MQNRKILNQFLKEYDDHAGLRRAFFPLPWIQELRYFIKNLKNDESITQSEKETLGTIINSRDMNDTHSDSQLSESDELARKILNVLSVPILDKNIKSDFDFPTLVKIFNYLRSEEIAQLMCLSKEFNRALRNPSIWREAVSSHFTDEFSTHKNNSKVNWFDLFKQCHREDYQGLSKRVKQLFSSVKSGDVLTLNALNMNLEDLYLQDTSKKSLITFAAQSPSQSFRNHIYHTFIRPFYLENEKDKLGLTHLYQAAAFSQFERVIALLANGANVDAARNDGRTPLWVAAQNGHFDVVRELLTNGANVSAAHNDGRTPLWIAAYNGYLDVVRELLANGANVGVAHNDGRTPLWAAAYNGHLDVVRVLIANDANVDAAHNISRTSPLWNAAYNGHLDLVRVLIANDANVNAAHNDGRTSLWTAACNGHLDVVRELLAANGANVDAARNNGVTPLWAAAENGHLDVVRVLLANGANVSAVCNDGITPLWTAAYNGHLDVVRDLLPNGANVDAARNNGVTPLWAASQNGHLDVVKELLTNGANVNATHNDGRTPLDVATKNGHTEVVKILSCAKLDTVINDMSNSPVSNHPATLFGGLFSKQYTKDEKLAAAVALKLATDLGDMSLLNEYREITENTPELAPLYRNLLK